MATLGNTGYMLESVSFNSVIVDDIISYRGGEIEELLALKNGKTKYPEKVVPIGYGGDFEVIVCGPDESWDVGQTGTIVVRYTTEGQSGRPLTLGRYRCVGIEHAGAGREQAATKYTFAKIGAATDFVAVAGT
jgi:hypothetical protein